MKDDIIKLVLPMPPSINATYKRGKNSFYKSKEAKAWEEEAGWALKKQWKRKPLEHRIGLQIDWYFKKERDISSGLKILEDLLQRQGVYINDSQIVMEFIRKEFDKDNPRVEILMAEL